MTSASTLVCVPIVVRDPESALADARQAKASGADLVEYRIDQFFSGTAANTTDSPDGLAAEERAILRLVAESPLPCIVTCRPEGPEGGDYDGPDEARITLFERLGTAFGPGEKPPRFIDVELSTYERSPDIKQKIRLAVHHPEQVRDTQPSLVLSTHDFTGRPMDLTRRILRMREEPGAAVCKVAYRCRSVRDNLELLELPAETGKPTIAVGIGEFGLLSRILAPKFGGFLTFASLRPTSSTAPGQPTLRELLCTYHFRSIRPTTAVYGVVGWPVEHSLSPLVHNAAFHTSGIDAVYVPIPIPPEYEHFKATMTALIEHPRLDFHGCSVTIPHKENLYRFALEQREKAQSAHGAIHPTVRWSIDASAAACGAANTLMIDREPSPHGGSRATGAMIANTDGSAAVECLKTRVGDLAPRRIAIIGAGGVARSIAAALMMADAAVVVANRTRNRADLLASQLSEFVPKHYFGPGTIAAVDLADLADMPLDAIVNCTPVGMTGGPDPDGVPINVCELRGCTPETVVLDTVYNPIITPLLRHAEAAGLGTIDGVAMFVRQAAAQFEAWTGKPAPLGLFELITREALTGPVPV